MFSRNRLSNNSIFGKSTSVINRFNTSRTRTSWNLSDTLNSIFNNFDEDFDDALATALLEKSKSDS